MDMERLPDPMRPQELASHQRISHDSISEIEFKTKQKVTIETSLVDGLSKCHPQEQSVLYYKIPKEIRDLIFAFATAQYEDHAHSYDPSERCYRPGYTGPHKSCTALLLTCRRVWLEANALLGRQAEITIWRNEGPQDRVSSGSLWAYNYSQNPSKNLHLFIQMCNAEQIRKPEIRWRRSRLYEYIPWYQYDRVTVTIRHSDWWNWEVDEHLHLDTTWVSALLEQLNDMGVRCFQLELETLKSKESQLRPIVDKILQLQCPPFRAAYDNEIMPNAPKFQLSGPPKVWNWVGSAELKGYGETPYARQNIKELNYHVEVITWNRDKLDNEPPAPKPWSRRRTGGSIPRRTPSLKTAIDRQIELTEGAHKRAQKMEEEMQETQFRSMMAPVWTETWMNRWKSTNSLLAFKPLDSEWNNMYINLKIKDEGEVFKRAKHDFD